MIKHIAFTAYPVKDMKRARTFYDALLGLKASKDLAGGKWVEYYLGDSCFALSSIAPQRFNSHTDGAAIAFEVDDVDKVFKESKELGASSLMEPTNTPVCRMAMIADPEGNFLTLHQKTADVKA